VSLLLDFFIAQIARNANMFRRLRRLVFRHGHVFMSITRNPCLRVILLFVRITIALPCRSTSVIAITMRRHCVLLTLIEKYVYLRIVSTATVAV